MRNHITTIIIGKAKPRHLYNVTLANKQNIAQRLGVSRHTVNNLIANGSLDLDIQHKK